MQEITIQSLRQAYKRNEYLFLENGELNIFGIRNSDMTAGVWNDIIGICYKREVPSNTYSQRDIFVLHLYQATVDPGSYYLKNPMNMKGTAVMKFQQGIGVYNMGLHAGKYEALKQVRPLSFYRITREQFLADGGKEIKLTGKPLSYETIGANIHRANLNSIAESVASHSAGCQVIRNPKDWMEFIDICWTSKFRPFNYALFPDKDFDFIGDLDPKTEKRV